MAVMEVSLLTMKLTAGVPPKLTPVTPVKPLPVMFTAVPPTSPLLGLIPVTAGTMAASCRTWALVRVVV
jgi:hypothetical protein